MVTEANLLERISNEVAKQKISNKQLRNEEIRRTGYAPEYMAPTQTPSGNQPPTLATLYQTNLNNAKTLDSLFGESGSSNDGGNTGGITGGTNAAGYSTSPAFDSQSMSMSNQFGGLGSWGGRAASQAAGTLMGQAGLPGLISSPASSLLGAFTSKGYLTNHDALNTIGKVGLSLANPVVGMLSSLFMSPLIDYIGKISGNYGIMSDPALNSLVAESLTQSINQSKQSMESWMADRENNIAAQDAQDAVNDAYGGRDGLSEALDNMGTLGDAPMSGSWSGGPVDGGLGFSDGQADSVW